MESSIRQWETGRFEIGLLWRCIKMPESCDMALRRLQCLKFKMRRVKKVLYQQFWEHVKCGYSRKLSPDEVKQTSDLTWFLHTFVMSTKSPIFVISERMAPWRFLFRTKAFVLNYLDVIPRRPGKLKTNLESNPYICRGETIPTITLEEIIRDDNSDFLVTQWNCFVEEMMPLSNAEVSKSNTLWKPSLYVGECGVVSHRVQVNAGCGAVFEAKQLIVVQHNHEISKMIILSYHRRYNHVNNATIIFGRFCIRRLCAAFKAVRARSQRGKISPAIIMGPEMCDLPVSRLSSHTRPFTFADMNLMLCGKWRWRRWFTDLFWQRWTKDYLPWMTRREKWNNKADPISVGSVIDESARSDWLREVVIEAKIGANGPTRTVVLKTFKGVYHRLMEEVAALDVNISKTPSQGIYGGTVEDTNAHPIAKVVSCKPNSKIDEREVRRRK